MGLSTNFDELTLYLFTLQINSSGLRFLNLIKLRKDPELYYVMTTDRKCFTKRNSVSQLTIRNRILLG